MNRFLWRLVGVLSRLVEPEEREAVLGDWTESGTHGALALAEIVGLVLRRQVSYWADWRPWLALVAVVLPIGVVLSHAARWWADGSAISLSFYVGGWTWGYLASPGARSDLFSTMTTIVFQATVLVMWSWTAGAVLGMLSRRARPLVALLFAVTVLGSTVGTATTARAFGVNSVVYSTVFYGYVVPWLFTGGLVLMPAWYGMRLGQRPTPLALRSAVMVGVSVVGLTIWMRRSLEAALVFGRGALPGAGLDGVVGTADDVWSFWWLPALMIWPTGYLLAAAVRERWNRSAGSRRGDILT